MSNRLNAAVISVPSAKNFSVRRDMLGNALKDRGSAFFDSRFLSRRDHSATLSSAESPLAIL